MVVEPKYRLSFVCKWRVWKLWCGHWSHPNRALSYALTFASMGEHCMHWALFHVNMGQLKWHVMYILPQEEGSGVTLEKILKFITGQSSIPPRGLKNSIKIDYNRDESFPYPKAECCFSIITLPVVYSTYPGFCKCNGQGNIVVRGSVSQGVGEELNKWKLKMKTQKLSYVFLTLSRARAQFCTMRVLIEWARAQFCTISKWPR